MNNHLETRHKEIVQVGLYLSALLAFKPELAPIAIVVGVIVNSYWLWET